MGDDFEVTAADAARRPPHIVLAAPTEIATAQTGGNIYNRALSAALADIAESPCDIVDSDAAIARMRSGRHTTVLVDTLLLEEVPDLVQARGPDDRIVLLGHSLPSLIPGPPLKRVEALVHRERELLKGIDAVIAPSPVAASIFRDRASHAVVWSLPPAIDMDPPSAPLGGDPGDALRALMVSNLVANKRVAELLECMAGASGIGDTLSLNIVGHADLEPEYAARCRAVAAGSDEMGKAVTFLGPLGREQVAQQLAEADVFVSASGFESFGMALQEACAFGLPVLACRGGNVESVASTQDCRLFDDVDGLGRALVSMSLSPKTTQDRRAARRPDLTLFERSWRDVATTVIARCAAL